MEAEPTASAVTFPPVIAPIARGYVADDASHSTCHVDATTTSEGSQEGTWQTTRRTPPATWTPQQQLSGYVHAFFT